MEAQSLARISVANSIACLCLCALGDQVLDQDGLPHIHFSGTLPSSVQIGNEIDCGLFHNWAGQPCSAGAEVCKCKGNWGNLAAVITACSKAIKSVAPSTELIVQLGASKNLANGDLYDTLFTFYTEIDKRGAPFDAFGLSFYQIWGGTNVSNLCTMGRLATALPDKRIYVIETGYPNKPGGHAPQDMKPKPEFAISPEGQVEWLKAVLYTVEHGLWGRGAGVSWWGTECVCWQPPRLPPHRSLFPL